jgi:hypothetical protein
MLVLSANIAQKPIALVKRYERHDELNKETENVIW